MNSPMIILSQHFLKSPCKYWIPVFTGSGSIRLQGMKKEQCYEVKNYGEFGVSFSEFLENPSIYMNGIFTNEYVVDLYS